MSGVFIGCIALWSFALLLGGAMSLLTYENARFGRSRLRSPVDRTFQPRTEVILPCKDIDRRFNDVVAALLHQDYPDYAVTFVVESKTDPAHQRLLGLLSSNAGPPVPTRVLVAGQTHERGQKLHNLLAAIAALPENAAALAFLDSDITIDRDWLARIIEPLRAENVGAVTGYRWFLPTPRNFASLVLSALNAPFALLLGNFMGNRGGNLIWGGSWSILRSTFQSAGIAHSWQHTLTEDLPAWHALRAAGLRVKYEPNCLSATPGDLTWPELMRFARRQYFLVRVYAPALWSTALAGEIVFNTAFWSAIILRAWAVAAVLFGLSALRASLQHWFVSMRFHNSRREIAKSTWLQILGGPVVRLLNLVLLASSAFGHRVTWRGIRYEVNGRDHVRVVSHRAQTWWRKTFDHLELQRAERIAQTLQRHLQAGDAVLDYGCGSQIVGETLQRRLGVRVTGLDTLDFRKRDLPFVLYDGFRAPFADRSFDVVLLSFVLHHCADGGLAVLKEAQRLARNKILLLEDSYENRAERLSIRLVDRVLNWLEDPRIEVPYRFRSIEQWKRLFAELGLALTSVESMRTTPLLHTRQRLFVLAPTSPDTAPN